MQIGMGDPQGRDICGDGLDNDCDGASDTSDAQGCVTLPQGDVCSLAFQSDVSGGGTFYGTLVGYGDDLNAGCGDENFGSAGGASSIERFYSITLSRLMVVAIEARPKSWDRQVGVALMGSCSDYGAQYCGGSYLQMEMAAGTHTFVLFGPATAEYDLSVSMFDPSEPSTCYPSDIDGDGFTLCTGDCAEGDPSIYPGAPELCDGVDNNCDFIVDNLMGPPSGCAVSGGTGACGSGVVTCQDGQSMCQGPLPGDMLEVCGDGVDNDCDGMADDQGTPGVDCFSGDSCADALDVQVGRGAFGELGSATHTILGCYDQSFGTSTPERFHRFEVYEPGYYYLSVFANESFAPAFAAGIFRGTCGQLENLGCNPQGLVNYYYLDTPGTYYVVVEGAGALSYQVLLAQKTAAGDCSFPDGDGDGRSVCDYDCDDSRFDTHEGAAEMCGNGLDDNCDGVVDGFNEGC